ncbi:aldehyde ferredoxin oxidoreductase C-terminal domain-containing protein [Romboutsia sp.]|uniref:aldehyde ferredoxin oxidoreductase C-terminal domain-containing protein n=1 Tax=Romboutsia sp. TaxID=1965302 RepID=UPI003F3AD52B
MLKIYRVNSRTKQVTLEERKVEECILGGRAFASDVILKEVNPLCDPLGSENKIVFATSMLAGSGAPTALRLSVGTKSPLTNGIKESNSGGTVAAGLAKHNIRAIIVEDKPEDDNWHYIKIDKDGNVTLENGNEFKEMNTYEFVLLMNAKYGEGVAFAGIGNAGARMYKSASLQVTDNTTGLPARAAARGGVGAVLGSKHIKGIVIEKTKGVKFPFPDKKAHAEAKKAFMDVIMNSPVCGMSMTGTIANIDPHALNGTLPNRNFSGEPISGAQVDKIGVKKFLSDIKENGGKTGLACQPGCVIRCSNIYNGKDGNMLTASLEYETIGLCGSNIDIYDLEFIAKMDHLCDDIGVDTIELGATIGVLMEAGKIPWGDKEAVLKAIEEMYNDTEFGKIVGNGTKDAGEFYNVKRVPVVRGQGMPAYDPRAVKGMGVTYATNPMGADHTSGATAFPGINHHSIEGQLEISASQQVASAVFDSTMCMFGWYAFGFEEETLQVVVNLINAMYGLEWSIEDMMNLGKETLAKEYMFNDLAGFKPEDYKLPKYFYEENSKATGTVFDLDDEVAKAYVGSYLSSMSTTN